MLCGYRVWANQFLSDWPVPVMIEGIEVLTYAKADFIKYAIDNSIPYAPY